MKRPYHPKPKKSTVFKRFDRWRIVWITGRPWTPARSLAVDQILERMDRAGFFDHPKEGALHG